MSNAALNARSDAILNAQEELASPESGASAVSWGAIIAGAVVASALSLALLMLGAGIGLVSVSPWSNNNVSVTTFGILAAAWFIAVQLFASGVGGYLAGRLRTRWVSVHTDEVYFRDTAHGLIVWGWRDRDCVAVDVRRGVGSERRRARWRLRPRGRRNRGRGIGGSSCCSGGIKRGKLDSLFYRHAISR